MPAFLYAPNCIRKNFTSVRCLGTTTAHFCLLVSFTHSFIHTLSKYLSLKQGRQVLRCCEKKHGLQVSLSQLLPLIHALGQRSSPPSTWWDRITRIRHQPRSQLNFCSWVLVHCRRFGNNDKNASIKWSYLQFGWLRFLTRNIAQRTLIPNTPFSHCDGRARLRTL